MDFESHRITTKAGRFRALVFSLTHSFVVRESLGDYAARVTTFYSMEELETWVRKRGWQIKRVRHFS